jgi:uncharacterized membrane protein HdeD (DUF308 family)
MPVDRVLSQLAVTLMLASAAFFAAHGIVQILTSLDHRRLFAQSWLWTAVSGVADLILAGIIIAGWPGSVAWALGLLIGINLFMSGLALVMTALACRSVNDASEKKRRCAARHDGGVVPQWWAEILERP